MSESKPATAQDGLRLITIHPSHYCEKARWALDLLGCPYKEEGYGPGLHVRAVANAAGKEHHSTPVLVVKERQQVLTDSADILAWVHSQNPDLNLFPDSQTICTTVQPPKLDNPASLTASSLQCYFDNELGPHTRRVIYFELLKYPTLFICTGMGLPQIHWAISALAKVSFSLVRLQMAYGFMQINETETKKSIERICEVFAEVEALLQDGRQYLTGDVFTAADLTFAALAAPVLLPLEYGAPMIPKLEDFPEASPSHVLLQEYRTMQAGQFALRLYKENRQVKKP